MSADFRFPNALEKPVRPFVGLTGLDVKHNAIHRTIWEAFVASKKEDRKRLAYKLFALDHIYPKPSRMDFVRMNYESYVPAGILKKTWMSKHMEEVPSVLVLFFDLDWTDPEWDSKQLECASRVECVRTGLQGRPTYLIVVLVQSTPPNLPGTANSSEEVLVRDRASQLYKTCSLVQGQLYLLPVLGRLETTARYVSQLEDALFSTAQKYYDQRVKKIKGHEDLLLLPQHNLLLVRYHFKTAFFTELRQDKQDLIKALEDYKKAYQLIVEVVPNMLDHLLEFKVISGYCSYKICSILFKMGEAEAALTQFRKHIDFFRTMTGPKMLGYEHASWMSKQYSGFADLLSAVVSTVKVSQRNHPGVYYQKAAFYAIERQKLCHTLCTKPSQSFASDVPALPEPDYVGQRPWRKGVADDQPYSPKVENDDVAIMQALEHKVEHPWQIIPLLTTATDCFNRFRSRRTVIALRVKMAEQYYQLKEYDKSLKLLMTSTEMYRAESWWSLLSSVLQLALRCAYLLAKANDYVSVACELIAKPVPLLHDEKVRIQENLVRILKGGVPDQESGVPVQCLQMAEDNWSALQEAGEASTFTLIASDLACYLECRGGILAGSGEEGEVTVKVFLRSTAPRDAAFSHVMVHFNLNEYDSFAVNKASDKIVLVTNQLRELEFKFLPLVQHTWERLEITSIDLVYHQGGEGTDKVFKWQGTGGEYGSTLGNDKYISTFKMAPSVYLTPRAGKLACKTVHSGSVLNGEVFPIQVQVENQEGSDVQDIEVTMSMGETRNHLHDDALLERAPSECPLGNAESPTKLCFTHESLASGANCDFSVFGCFMGLGLRKCYIRVLYSVRVASSDHPSDPPRLCRCMKEEVLEMEVVQPFILSSLLKNMKLERQDSIHLDQPFLFVNILNSKSSYPIEILDIQYQKPQCISVCGQLPTVFKDQPLEQDDVSQHCFCLLVTSQEQVGSSLSLGKITIQWRRKHGSEGLPAVSVSEILPTVAVQNLPFIIQPDIPSSGTVNSLLPLSFTLWNKSEIVQEYEIKMIQDDDTHFKVSGNQMHHFRILPGSSYAVRYNLFPTQAGHMNLPIFHMTYCRDPKNYDDYLRHQIPTHIDILKYLLCCLKSNLLSVTFHCFGTTSQPCDKTSRLVQI